MTAHLNSTQLFIYICLHVHVHLLELVRRRQHDDVLALAAGKAQDVLVAQLKVAARLKRLAVELGAVAALEINHVRLDPAALRLDAKLVLDSLGNVPELDHGVLAARARVLERVVDDGVRAAQQPAALLPELQRVDYVGALEDEDAPRLRGRRLAGFGGLVVFERDLGAFDAVGELGEDACGLEVGLLLCWGCAAVLCGWLGRVVEAAE
jgi:hypothetical protein